MTTVYLAPGPFGAGGQFFGLGGLPLNLGTITTYAAGSTTPLATYTTSLGNVQNANPIPLGLDGRPPNEIWITSDAYRFDLKDSLGNLIRTYDDISTATSAANITFLQAGAGAVTRTVQSKFRESVSVGDFGAVCDSNGTTGVGTDDTAAVQAAVNTGKAVYFPAICRTTSKINFNTIGQKFHGSAMELAGVYIDAADHAFKYSGSGLMRCFFRDMSITGKSTSLNGIDFSTSTNLYESTFENLTLYCGGKAIYAPLEFSTTFTNVHHSSYNDNGIEISGSNSTNLNGCYGHTFPVAKYPYRIYGNATLIACNGVDTGENWGLFGQDVANDGVNTIFRITMIGCNIEDFTSRGLRFRYTGSATLIEPTFLPKSNYDCSVYVEFTDQLITLINPTFSPKGGAVRTKLAEVFYLAGNGPLFIGGSTTSYDLNGTLITAPVITVGQATSTIEGVSINNLVMGRGFGFYSPNMTTWTANATTFAVTSLDRVKTANSNPTAMAQATGGIDGQVLVIHVRDANSTIKHNTGGAGRFMNSSAADITASNGRPYTYVSDGSIWWQI